jgi:hypothetical protein
MGGMKTIKRDRPIIAEISESYSGEFSLEHAQTVGKMLLEEGIKFFEFVKSVQNLITCLFP